MTISQMALLWFGGFLNVFLLGFQSRNAHAGRYAVCAVTSFLIAGAQLVFVRGAISGDPLTVLLLVGTSGSVGICTAIYVHQVLFERKTNADR